jgi:exopolysaccharide biosynthesis polyprenyl glycosylphosphotransferase
LGVTCVAFVLAYLLRSFLVHYPFFSRALPRHLSRSAIICRLLAAFLCWSGRPSATSPASTATWSSATCIRLILGTSPASLAVVLVVVYALLYLLRRGDISRSYVLLIGSGRFRAAAVAGAPCIVLGRLVSCATASDAIHYSAAGRLRPARAGDGDADRGKSHGMGLRLLGFVDPEIGGRLGQDKLSGYQVYPLESVGSILQNHVVDEVVFAVDLQDLARLEAVMQHCADLGIRTRLQLEFLPPAYSRIYLENFRDVQLLSLSSAPDSELRLFFKRVIDVVLSATALVVLSPVLLAIAAMIKITSPGPVLFQQTRCGLGGRRFTLYKFRSMINNAEQLRAELHQLNELDGPVFKISDDPRITTVGRWLRRFSLDELPQLWNVFRGDMSFVGPRPAVPDEVQQYEDWQRRRLRMRPGLTCTWVLEGRSHVDFNRWMQLDLKYIDNWSLWLDAKIFPAYDPDRALRPRGVLSLVGYDKA